MNTRKTKEKDMIRVEPHVIETRSKDIVRGKINSFYSNGDSLVREITGRDYGVDFILEVFEKRIPTGKIAYLQIKGTEKEIKRLSREEAVSCSGVSASSLYYSKQDRVPFVLIYVSTKEKCFYFDIIQNNKSINKKSSFLQKKYTIRIPLENKVENDLSLFFDKINNFFCD